MLKEWITVICVALVLEKIGKTVQGKHRNISVRMESKNFKIRVNNEKKGHIKMGKHGVACIRRSVFSLTDNIRSWGGTLLSGLNKMS